MTQNESVQKALDIAKDALRKAMTGYIGQYTEEETREFLKLLSEKIKETSEELINNLEVFGSVEVEADYDKEQVVITYHIKLLDDFKE